jgi:dTDP-4-amino-4,6-dideoxygalactose transaminase
MDPIPFHVPEIDESDVSAVTDVLRSRWLTTGERCRRFEEEFASYVGAPHAIATNSGTAAMHLALEAVGIGPGDLVLVPVMTFTATAEVVRYLGADPVFVDVDPRDANMGCEQVLARLDHLADGAGSRIRAIMPVHYAGRACDMTGLCSLAAEREWHVVDDAAHALPTTHGGRSVGTWGNATAFSFYATKSLSTGEGGMVVTGDSNVADRMRVMRLHGISRDAFDRYRSPGAGWEYEIVAPGFKYNLTDLAAALGLQQLARLDRMAAARESIARRYDAGLETSAELILPPGAEAGERHSWHLYSVRVRGDRARRDRVIELLAEAGVATSVHFIPLHRMPYWRERYDLVGTDFPVAEEIFSGQFSLPIYPSLSPDQVDRVIDALLTAVAATA